MARSPAAEPLRRRSTSPPSLKGHPVRVETLDLAGWYGALHSAGAPGTQARSSPWCVGHVLVASERGQARSESKEPGPPVGEVASQD
jgi:hypothetical protein